MILDNNMIKYNLAEIKEIVNKNLYKNKKNWVYFSLLIKYDYFRERIKV